MLLKTLKINDYTIEIGKWGSKLIYSKITYRKNGFIDRIQDSQYFNNLKELFTALRAEVA